jgi:hypothetical protein
MKWELPSTEGEPLGRNDGVEKEVPNPSERFLRKEESRLGIEKPGDPPKMSRMRRLAKVLSLAASMFAAAESSHAVELLYEGDASRPLTKLEIAIKDLRQDEAAQAHIKEAYDKRDEHQKTVSEKIQKFGKFAVIQPDHHRFHGLSEELMLIDDQNHVLGRLLSGSIKITDEEIEEQVPRVLKETGHVKGGAPIVFQSERVLEHFNNAHSRLEPGKIITPGTDIEVNSDGNTLDVEIGQNGEHGFTVRSHNKHSIEFASFTGDGALEHYAKFPYDPDKAQ